MQALFADVFDSYFSTRAKLGGVAKIIQSPDQNSILKGIPQIFQKYLRDRNKFSLYAVTGSIGKGNIARVPWVGLFRRDITDNAENGYYIVLLFSEDMSGCYLRLNQGITAIEKAYTKSFALRKMRESARRALTYLECEPEAWRGPIDLKSSADLGRSYEAAAVVSYKYLRNDIPDEKLLFQHLDRLVDHYEHLYQLFGKDLHSLISISENEFQQVVLEKAAQPGALKEHLNSGADAADQGTLRQATKGYVRSPAVAAEAIRAADFLCEIDPNHRTFISRAKKQQYVEAHHLIPMSQQSRFPVSLDVVANVIALCANCHRMLHYGAEQNRRSLLLSLLKKRKKELSEKSINVEKSDFLRFYANGAVIEE